MTECWPRTVKVGSAGVLLVHPDGSPPDLYAYVRDAKVARICVPHGRVVYDVAKRKEAS